MDGEVAHGTRTFFIAVRTVAVITREMDVGTSYVEEETADQATDAFDWEIVFQIRSAFSDFQIGLAIANPFWFVPSSIGAAVRKNRRRISAALNLDIVILGSEMMRNCFRHCRGR